MTVLEIVLTAACLSCLAGVWHYYDVAKQDRAMRTYWHDLHLTERASWQETFAKLRVDRDEWKRQHQALLLLVKMRADGRRRDDE